MGAVVIGYVSFYVALSCLRILLWFFDYELTASQRVFVVENGYLAFIVGLVLGMTVFWRLLRLRKVKHSG